MSGGHVLSIDVGNTRVSWALFDSARVVEHGRALHAELAEGLPDAWGRASLVGLASVHSGAADTIRSRWPSRFPALPAPLRPADIPIETAVLRPERVGVDRLLAALAARRQDPTRPVVVVDFGTAITVDPVSADGRFLGGCIVPGPELLAAALSRGTDRLPDLAIEPDHAPVGEDTERAIVRGISGLIAGGVSRLVEGAAGAVAGPDGPAPRVVATGGGAERWAPAVEAIEEIDPFLCREGIRLALSGGTPA